MSNNSKFRPCIDLHLGQVKQIIGGTLDTNLLKTNFISILPSSYYVKLYKDQNLRGGHIIKLGPGNDDAAKEALMTWPDSLHLGGGITDQNSLQWIDFGAEKVIVTSFLFPEGKFNLNRLRKLTEQVEKKRLVVDVSCRKKGTKWIVAMNRWQDLTDMEVNEESLSMLSEYSSEFLIHAADVEGLCEGIDESLVQKLGEWCNIPTTYAGGAKHLNDLDLVNKLSNGKIDLTYGSALDIFGGTLVKFQDLVEYNNKMC